MIGSGPFSLVSVRFTGSPAEGRCPPVTAGVLAGLQNCQVMAPADFSHQWCEFFQAGVRLEKSFHPPEVGGRKAAHAGKLRPQIGGELFNHRLAPALGLLPLHDQPADIPVQADQFPVDRFEGFILGGADGFPIRVNASGLREMAVRLKKMAPIFLAACGHFIA